MGLGDRLAEALQHSGMTRRDLIDATRPIEGSSYPSLRSYIREETEPSLRFLRRAATVLGVREAWLITGEGQRTEAERAAQILDPDKKWRAKVLAIWRSAGLYRTTEHLPTTQVRFGEVAIRMGLLTPDDPDQGDFEAGCEGLEAAVLTILELVLPRKIQLPEEEVHASSAYLRAILMAFEQALDLRDETLTPEQVTKAEELTTASLVSQGRLGRLWDEGRRSRSEDSGSD